MSAPSRVHTIATDEEAEAEERRRRGPDMAPKRGAKELVAALTAREGLAAIPRESLVPDLGKTILAWITNPRVATTQRRTSPRRGRPASISYANVARLVMLLICVQRMDVRVGTATQYVMQMLRLRPSQERTARRLAAKAMANGWVLLKDPEWTEAEVSAARAVRLTTRGRPSIAR